MLGNERPKILENRAHREQAPVGGHELQELRRQPADPGAVEHRRKRLQLFPAENTGLRTTRQIGAFGHQGVETIEIGLHGVDGPALARKLEQGGRVATRHAGNDRSFASNSRLA